MENYESDVSSPFLLDDLQLAAELGKSLLERNMELEDQLKACKSKSYDQEVEILHLRRHMNTQAEESEARIKVYEHMDLMLQELERANQRLSVEMCRDKDQIKLLVTNIGILEARCEQLSHQLNISRQSLDRVDRYRQERHTNSQMMPRAEEMMGFPEIQPIVLARHDNLSLCHCNLALSLADDEDPLKSEASDDLIRLLGEMETVMRDFLAERRRCGELEEQMCTVIHENQYLQRRLAEDTAGGQETMSVREEVSLLDEVRQGRMCSRCLGNINMNVSNLNHKCSQTDESLVANLVPKDEFAGMASSTIITEQLEQKTNTASTPTPMNLVEEDGRVLKVLRREPIEPMTLAAGIKKKNRRKHRQGFENFETVEQGDAPPTSTCGSASPSPSMAFSGKWNGHGMMIYNQDMELAPSTSQGIKKNVFPHATGQRCPKTLGDYFPSTFRSINSSQ